MLLLFEFSMSQGNIVVEIRTLTWNKTEKKFFLFCLNTSIYNVYINECLKQLLNLQCVSLELKEEKKKYKKMCFFAEVFSNQLKKLLWMGSVCVFPLLDTLNHNRKSIDNNNFAKLELILNFKRNFSLRLPYFVSYLCIIIGVISLDNVSFFRFGIEKCIM